MRKRRLKAAFTPVPARDMAEATKKSSVCLFANPNSKYQ
jgi:hypothetical protein